MKREKWKKRIMLIGAFALLMLASAVSYAKFEVADPFSTASGIIQVVLTDTEYVQIQDHPKVIVAKPGASLDEYMERYGYTPDPEEQMGALCVYSTRTSREMVYYSENRFFSRWSWME